MIPYYEPPSLHLGPFTVQVFGLLAALGVYTGARVSMRAARDDGLDARVVADYAVWGVLWGVIGGHLIHLFMYHQEELREPYRIFMVWEGLSSFGGLLGAVLAAFVYFRRHRIALAPYTDAFALGLAPGWGIARLGCFAIHDHPGVRTSFPLAVAFPGGARHDLGLYDAIALFAMTALLFALRHRGLLRGRLLAVLGLVYGTSRFLLDFLRARPGDVPYADARYFGLTPAQYFCFALWGYAIWRLASYRAPAADAPPARTAAVAGGRHG